MEFGGVNQNFEIEWRLIGLNVSSRSTRLSAIIPSHLRGGQLF